MRTLALSRRQTRILWVWASLVCLMILFPPVQYQYRGQRVDDGYGILFLGKVEFLKYHWNPQTEESTLEGLTWRTRDADVNLTRLLLQCVLVTIPLAVAFWTVRSPSGSET